MFRGAIGIVETIGLVGSIEAADAMTKTAQVELVGREDVGGGYHSVCVRGDVGSVRAALEAGARAAEAVGRVVGVLLIPRPHDDLDVLFADPPSGGHPGTRPATLPSPETLASLNVHKLRALARRLPDFPMQGREISAANRKQLIETLERQRPEPGDAD